jgi:hypothetical protein
VFFRQILADGPNESSAALIFKDSDLFRCPKAMRLTHRRSSLQRQHFGRF